jgi:hypothetical protein
MMRLKTTEVKPYREEHLRDQDYCCALCGELIFDDAVLDHDHRSGYIRGVLHRGCNALLGKIENSMAMNRITPARLTAILTNYNTYVSQHHAVLHPSYKTAEERKQRAKVRAQRRRAKLKLEKTQCLT